MQSIAVIAITVITILAMAACGTTGSSGTSVSRTSTAAASSTSSTEPGKLTIAGLDKYNGLFIQAEANEGAIEAGSHIMQLH